MVVLSRDPHRYRTYDGVSYASHEPGFQVVMILSEQLMSKDPIEPSWLREVLPFLRFIAADIRAESNRLNELGTDYYHQCTTVRSSSGRLS